MHSVKELKQIKYIFGSFDKLNHYIPSYSDTLKSSWPPDLTAAVAQWLERSPRKREVVGSIPDHVIPKTL